MKDGWTIYNTINPSSLKATNEILQPFKKTTKNKDITAINAQINNKDSFFMV